MSAKLDVQESVQDARHTLVVSGELDVSTVGELVEALDRVCASGPEAITLDLGGLTFMDSTGIHAVLRARHACEVRAVDFRAIVGTGPVARLFELCGLPAAGHAAESPP